MNSKFEKWNELPMEMRMECVKWLDFKSRMMLRATSHTEKLIVESAPKYRFDKVDVELRFVAPQYQPVVDFSTDFRSVIFKDNTLQIIKKSRVTGTDEEEILQKSRRLVAQILKFAVIDHFQFMWLGEDNDGADGWKLATSFVNRGPFRAKKLVLKFNSKLADCFLPNCVGVEEMELMQCSSPDLGTYQSVIDAKLVYLSFCDSNNVSNNLIEKWIEKDVEFGKVLLIELIEDADPTFCAFTADAFANRVLYESDDELRLQTDNPTKHILIRLNQCLRFGDRVRRFYAVTMIAASSEKH